MIDYYLKSAASGSVVVEILDAKNELVRHYSSEDHTSAIKVNTLEFPAFWRTTPLSLSTSAGMHRWIWDLHYTPVAGGGRFGGGGFGPGGVVALPGTYTVKLTLEGKTYTQPLTVKMDPRSKTPVVDLQQEFAVAMEVAHSQSEINRTQHDVQQLRSQVRQLRPQVQSNAALVSALDALDHMAEAVGGTPPASVIYGVPVEPLKERVSLTVLNGEFAQIAFAVNSGDGPPTAEARKAFADAQATLTATLAKWSTLTAKDLPATNAQLKQAGLAPIVVGPGGPAVQAAAPQAEFD